LTCPPLKSALSEPGKSHDAEDQAGATTDVPLAQLDRALDYELSGQ